MLDTWLLLQLRDKKSVQFCSQLWLFSPFLRDKNFTPLSAQELTVMGQKFVGVFVYAESTWMQHFPSVARLQNLAIVPGSRHS